MSKNKSGKRNNAKAAPRKSLPAIDPIQIFNTADSFFHVGEILVSVGNVNPGLPIRCGAAYAAIMALAIELFLKCLIAIEGSRPNRTHNLKTLFLSLKTLHQEEIRHKFNEYASVQVPKFIAVTPKEHGHDERFSRMSDFDKALECSANAFENFRYLHEGAGGDFFVPALAGIVRKLILDVKSDWKNT